MHYMTTPSPDTVNAVLDRIDEVLASGGAESRQLWDILTALRGPDSGDIVVKRDYTAPIRAAAFPRSADANSRFSLAFMWPTTLPSVHTAQLDQHFFSHIDTALTALHEINRTPFDYTT